MLVLFVLGKILLFFRYIIAIGMVQILLIIAIIFFILIVLAVVKSIRLRKESNRLSDALLESEENKQYQDFTEGHLYENKNEN